jgi:hypothetical protein
MPIASRAGLAPQLVELSWNAFEKRSTVYDGTAFAV